MSGLPPTVNGSAPPAIDIRYLRVDYGNFVAVDDLTLTVPPGEVFGLVGPNGAGKTSTFRVLTTLMEPTYGEVILNGVDVFEDLESARRIIGYMPDLAPVPTDLKVWEFLDFHAAAYGLGNRAQRRERVAECLEEVALTPQRESWCKALSRGQTQRVVLAKTLCTVRAFSSSTNPRAGSIPSPAAICATPCASSPNPARRSSSVRTS
jgi:ABC-2 type transport system ATP-binding protein